MKGIARSLLFGGTEPTVIYECRRCGTGVSSLEATCFRCGTDRIAEYTIE